MNRRDARLRREYLYRKSLEGKRAAEFTRRLSIRNSLSSGTPIPTELRNASTRLLAKDEWTDALHDAPTTHRDDEYANAGTTRPKVVITTSRSPSTRLGMFAKELRRIWPGAIRVNRGNLVTSDLVSMCRANGMTDLVVVHENQGQPDGLIVSHLPFGPTAFFALRNVVLRKDVEGMGTVKEVDPHIILHGLTTRLGKRVGDVLKCMFPSGKEGGKRVMTFANFNDWISFRQHTWEKDRQEVHLTEVGPRWEMQLYQLRLGTLEQTEADNEWVLRPYMNTAKRRRALG